ncbi:MAG: nucleotidyltransferase substrate binding protein [Burkholderiales bacterium]|jgi:nucleotidyltransferase substrate binding protein (TIGR01987 family)|nr:nucleotidyltransferase substrate binding protein [Burkholderiales bacterium]MCA3166067.1 nucleotidyltransferase substrate binding protein [Burkholderiales bacterium]MCA3171028.1 nucleotidyltransferase substrate binding protein [Burkholderiales bacterium]MCA3173586.1 nucleotidyltransferase substrate binding protein [Burkholderiales bacterium]MCA3176658.1 nucleotidyltransferase substrate binding protein [Burkholderiales bacterium]
MPLNVEHLLRTANTLEQALLAIEAQENREDVRFDLYRNAAIKSFELSLETAGKLLRKALKAYGGAPREVDKLVFNDVLRHAGKHGLMDVSTVERWLSYRANRNNTAHDYGEGFANDTLKLLPTYLNDVRALAPAIQKVFDATA